MINTTLFQLIDNSFFNKAILYWQLLLCSAMVVSLNLIVTGQPGMGTVGSTQQQLLGLSLKHNFKMDKRLLLRVFQQPGNLVWATDATFNILHCH